MTDKNKTQLLMIVDRSGSMARIVNDMIGGIDEFFTAQAKLPGECVVDYVQFDTEYELVFKDVSVADAKAQLKPRGGTALLDAMGKGVTELGEKLAKQSEAERPGTVIVVIVTDGDENSSREWKRDAVKTLIESQQDKYNWDFVFLGANMDAVAEAATFGIKGGSSMTYDTHNTGQTMASMSAYAGNTRTHGAGTQVFTDEDRKKAVKKDSSRS